jgi:hypothetical protein
VTRVRIVYTCLQLCEPRVAPSVLLAHWSITSGVHNCSASAASYESRALFVSLPTQCPGLLMKHVYGVVSASSPRVVSASSFLTRVTVGGLQAFLLREYTIRVPVFPPSIS